MVCHGNTIEKKEEFPHVIYKEKIAGTVKT